MACLYKWQKKNCLSHVLSSCRLQQQYNKNTMNVKYSEIKPSKALEPYVDSYWLQTFDNLGNDTSPVQSCPPFGMTELIVHLDDSHCECSWTVHGAGCPGSSWLVFIASLYYGARRAIPANLAYASNRRRSTCCSGRRLPRFSRIIPLLRT